MLLILQPTENHPSPVLLVTKLEWKAENLKELFSILISLDCSKRVTWRNMPQLKLWNIKVIFPNSQTLPRVAKNIWRTIYARPVGLKNILEYLFKVDIMCSEKSHKQFFESEVTASLDHRPRKTACLSEQTMSKDRYPSMFSHQMDAIFYICCW